MPPEQRKPSLTLASMPGAERHDDAGDSARTTGRTRCRPRYESARTRGCLTLSGLAAASPIAERVSTSTRESPTPAAGVVFVVSHPDLRRLSRNPSVTDEDSAAQSGRLYGGISVLYEDRDLLTLWHSLVRVCEPIVRSRDDAEDCASDAMVCALTTPTTAVNREAWLVTVAKRRAVDQLRRRMRSRARVQRLAHDVTPAPDIAMPLPTPMRRAGWPKRCHGFSPARRGRCSTSWSRVDRSTTPRSSWESRGARPSRICCGHGRHCERTLGGGRLPRAARSRRRAAGPCPARTPSRRSVRLPGRRTSKWSPCGLPGWVAWCPQGRWPRPARHRRQG